jgi:hypothetical protein
MADPSTQLQPARSPRRSFWILVALAVPATGALTSAIAAPPSSLTGLRAAASALVLTASLALATRVMIGVEHARRRDREGQSRTGQT